MNVYLFTLFFFIYSIYLITKHIFSFTILNFQSILKYSDMLQIVEVH